MVYLGNLARQQQNIPPLRWNAQLTDASRWFSHDSVVNRPEPYCGHQDTQGNWPDVRAIGHGYQGSASAENAFCGMISPQGAIDGWLASSGHRQNLLNPKFREVGAGYYHQEGDGGGQGYVTAMYGRDVSYPPVIINNEALFAPFPEVELYIYSNETAVGDVDRIGKTVEMMISNEPTFAGGQWEPYTPQRKWSLLPGEGWRTVYVKMRDQLGRTITVHDTIYLGKEEPPRYQLGDVQMSTSHKSVQVTGLDGGGLPQVQFSLGWLMDDLFESFKLWWGGGEREDDPQGVGGTTFHLVPGDTESFVWVSSTNVVPNIPLVAYFRLKVSDNLLDKEVARIAVEANGVEHGPIPLKGTDFPRHGQYHEFAIPFTFTPTEDEIFVVMKAWRSSSVDLYVDSVSIFTAPQPIAETIEWQVPGGSYRGQGVWVRYTDGESQFSLMEEAQITLPTPPIPTPRAETATPQPQPTEPQPGEETIVAPTNQPTVQSTAPPEQQPTTPPTEPTTPPDQQPTTPPEQQPTAPPSTDPMCFDETGFCSSGRIAQFWQNNGGLQVFGYPITPQQEERVEGAAIPSQWFERNRLELHPENEPPYDVLLGRLGVDRLEAQGRDWRNFSKSEPKEGCLYFEQTGHNICDDILEAWQSHGLEFDGVPGTSQAESLALFGLPISGLNKERLSDGREYTVQWFERARFELHPENDPPYHVLLGLLGNELRGNP